LTAASHTSVGSPCSVFARRNRTRLLVDWCGLQYRSAGKHAVTQLPKLDLHAGIDGAKLYSVAVMVRQLVAQRALSRRDLAAPSSLVGPLFVVSAIKTPSVTIANSKATAFQPYGGFSFSNRNIWMAPRCFRLLQRVDLLFELARILFEGAYWQGTQQPQRCARLPCCGIGPMS
jgi:hypothetical protein